jgi:hypothetical protein
MRPPRLHLRGMENGSASRWPDATGKFTEKVTVTLIGRG